MREILFRGKRVDNGEWLYGFYAAEPNGRQGDGAVHLIQPLDDNGRFDILRRVAPETVGQYTGLTDKNGKKIFEGDILRYSYDYEGSPWLTEDIRYHQGTVFWSEWRGSWAVCARGNDDHMNQDVHVYCRNPNRVEVIGNIHDNPELLTEATP